MNWNHRAMVLTAILVVSVTGPALGTTPTAEFDSQSVETPVGDTAEIPITLSNTDTATVRIGSDRVNYIATVTVEDGNDDRNVTLLYNTSEAGHDGGFSTADDADTVTVQSETEFKDGQLIDPAAYSLAVEPGRGDVDNATDAATLRVTEPTDPATTESETTTAASSPAAGHVTDLEDGVVVAPAKNQTITGSLDVESGTEIRLRVSSQELNFLKTGSATATEDGRFRVSFDFDELQGEVENGTEFDVTIRADGKLVREARGRIDTSLALQKTTTKQPLQDETTHNATRSSDGGVPGFGLAAGSLAVTAGVLLALRRTD